MFDVGDGNTRTAQTLILSCTQSQPTASSHCTSSGTSPVALKCLRSLSRSSSDCSLMPASQTTNPTSTKEESGYVVFSGIRALPARDVATWQGGTHRHANKTVKRTSKHQHIGTKWIYALPCADCFHSQRLTNVRTQPQAHMQLLTYKQMYQCTHKYTRTYVQP